MTLDRENHVTEAGNPTQLLTIRPSVQFGGAISLLTIGGKSLLPVGVVRVEGRFQRGDLVDCVSVVTGETIARGLVNYSAEDALKIAGKASGAIEELLGFIDEPELIHRDNMVVL